ncbi:MAG: hypothetical protein AAF400_01415 [Bacteroidota bacterium]
MIIYFYNAEPFYLRAVFVGLTTAAMCQRFGDDERCLKLSHLSAANIKAVLTGTPPGRGERDRSSKRRWWEDAGEGHRSGSLPSIMAMAIFK